MRIKHALPHAELHVIRNASHMAFYENPDDYYPILTGFLEKHSR